MKIVVAPNAFKDCLSSSETASAIEEGIRKVMPSAEVVKIPVADGGDGLLEVLKDYLEAEYYSVEVKDPLMRTIKAEFLYSCSLKTAVIEMAVASGIALLNINERSAIKTSSYGTGQLILKALELGAEKIYLGIGGSATNDGGIGLLTALGMEFTDENNQPLVPIGESLPKIAKIDSSNLNSALKNKRIAIICDVENPFYGENGAAYVYGPQKGVTKNEVEYLNRGLINFADIIYKTTKVDVSNISGAGAAGGIGGGLVGLLGAEIKPGIDTVLEILDFEKQAINADLIITAEGRIDNQTANNKAPAGVAKVAKRLGIPCVGIAGSIGDNIENLHGIGMTSLFSIVPGPCTLPEAIHKGKENIIKTTEQLIRLILKFHS